MTASWIYRGRGRSVLAASSGVALAFLVGLDGVQYFLGSC